MAQHGGTLAKFGGVCPRCSRFIAANRSRVIALEQPHVPRVKILDGGYVVSADDGGFYNSDGSEPPRMHEKRRWVHSRCVSK